MAGLLGEGGQGNINGTYSATSPLVLMDFVPCITPACGVDGESANGITLLNLDTSSTYYVRGRVQGLQQYSTASYFTIAPATSQTFQVGWESNQVAYVVGWVTNATNGALADTINVPVAGFVSIRRH
jgi:hypothetical protein